jgi:hypothetical protein
MNITDIFRQNSIVMLAVLGLILSVISGESAASKIQDKRVFIAPKLYQGPDFQVFALVAAQGNGRSLIQTLPDKSFYQRGLVLPAASMRMAAAIIDDDALATNERNHPNKAGLLNRPTLVIGGKLSRLNKSPLVGFMQLRLPYVKLKDENQSVRDLYVNVKVVGGKYKVSDSYTSTASLPVRALNRVPWKYGRRLTNGLPDHKTNQLLDFELSYGATNARFADELMHAIQQGGTLHISVYEALGSSVSKYDYDDSGKLLFEIHYTFEGEPHNSTEKYLSVIIKSSTDDLLNGKGKYAGEI